MSDEKIEDYTPVQAEDPRQPDYGEMRTQLAQNALTKGNAREALARQAMFGVTPGCKGQLTIGIFFDGTGNNKDTDYGPEKRPFPFLKRHHSNIVRLFHAFPDEEDECPHRYTSGTTNRVYRYYVPGVGTKFDEVGDRLNIPGISLAEAALGAGAGAGGDARIMWAMAQVLNAVYRFYTTTPTIITEHDVQNSLKQIVAKEKQSNRTWKRVSKRDTMLKAPASETSQYTYEWLSQDENRNKVYLEWFKQKIRPRLDNENPRRKLTQINIHVFGFSRGAAEARAFANYFLEAIKFIQNNCYGRVGEIENPGSTHVRKKAYLGLIPVHFQFMGILDTVASVGVASLYSFSEGHSSWGARQQVPPEVGKCVHLIAAHEIRACFPLDSVRVEDTYPRNCLEEVVHAGAHSDIGGGYSLNALGKDDLGDPEKEEDLQLARVIGFDMYCRALTAGVPFYTLNQLENWDEWGAAFAKQLKPDLRTLNELERYYTTAAITSGPVEDQLRKHTGYYLAWRWEQELTYFEQYKKDYSGILSKVRRLIEHERGMLMNMLITASNAVGFEKDAPEKREIRIKIYEDFQKHIQARQAAVYDPKFQPTPEFDTLNRLQTRAVFRAQGGGDDARKSDMKALEGTQMNILKVANAYASEIMHRIKDEDFDPFPLANNLSLFPDSLWGSAQYLLKNAGPWAAKKALVWAGKLTAEQVAKANAVTRLITVGKLVGKALEGENYAMTCYFARLAPAYLDWWHEILKEHGAPVQYNAAAPERETLYLLEALKDWQSKPKEFKKTLGAFFAHHVHDSEAGFSFPPEFWLNGYGLAKFRRVYWGDRGDGYLRDKIHYENLERYNASLAKGSTLKGMKRELKKPRLYLLGAADPISMDDDTLLALCEIWEESMTGVETDGLPDTTAIA
jgi:hypothetical protein